MHAQLPVPDCDYWRGRLWQLEERGIGRVAPRYRNNKKTDYFFGPVFHPRAPALGYGAASARQAKVAAWECVLAILVYIKVDGWLDMALQGDLPRVMLSRQEAW